jgi:hypothetical protein
MHQSMEGRVKRDTALVALAYNLGNFLRTLTTPDAIAEWSCRALPLCDRRQWLRQLEHPGDCAKKQTTGRCALMSLHQV